MTHRDRETVSKRKAIRDLEAYEDTLTIDVEKTVQRIRDRAKILHTEVDRFVSTMLNKLRSSFEKEMQRIRYALDKLKGNSKGPGSRTSSLNKTPRYRSTPMTQKSIDFGLNSHNSNYDDIDNDEQFQKKEVRYFDGEISEINLRNLIGHFTFENSSSIAFTAIQRSLQANARSEVKLIKAFKCGDKSETVHAIAPVDDDQAWICCGWGSRTLHLYDRLGHKKKSATLDIQVNDATTFYDGQDDVVLVSSYREKSIKRLNQESSRTTDFAYISLYPGGLSWDRRTGIYVCFRDSYHRPVTFGSRRMIAKLSKHGEIVSTSEKDEDQKNIFGYPFRIAVNVNGDICVSDYGDGTRGVTLLYKDGRVKCWYKGPPPSMALDQPFLPHGICCDDDGHILVADWNNDCIHVLDADGNFLLHLVNHRDGIEGPNAVAVDRRGYLWVGDSHGVVRVYKYNVVND